MRVRIHTVGYALIDARTRVRYSHGDVWDWDADAAPDWCPVHNALSRGDVVCVDPPSTPASLSKSGKPADSDADVGAMTRAALWRALKARGLHTALSYSTATRDEMIAALGGHDGDL